MSGFSPSQLKKLTGKLDRSHVQTRSVEGRQLDYIEGWFALSEANAIFGFANWDRETVHFERLFERVRGEMTTCAYSARVRIRVRAGENTILREGTGCGTASARNAADAHERAIKAAETDATKRALATFGNRFGLCLYDKEQAGVSEPSSRTLEVVCPDGQIFAGSLSPEGFCTALRKIIESTTDTAELSAWQERNAPAIITPAHARTRSQDPARRALCRRAGEVVSRKAAGPSRRSDRHRGRERGAGLDGQRGIRCAPWLDIPACALAHRLRTTHRQGCAHLQNGSTPA